MQLWWLLSAHADARPDDAASPAPSPPLRAVHAPPAAAIPADSRVVEARALVSIAWADGAPSATERRWLERACGPIHCRAFGGRIAVEARVHRPRETGEVTSPVTALRILSRMLELALVDASDGRLDASERAVLLAHARHWRIDDEVVARLGERVVGERGFGAGFAALLMGARGRWRSHD